jgi:hypothetical protein
MRIARFRTIAARKQIAAAGTLASILAASTVRGDLVVLDNQDCPDWTTTTDVIVWKQKGSALAPHSLLKFNLADLGPVQSVTKATLHLFIERGYPAATLEVYHVHDDTWSYRYTHPGQLYNWPTMELIASVAATDSATVALDVTPQLIEDLADGVLSIKLESTPEFAPIRVTSPLAPRWITAPRLQVNFGKLRVIRPAVAGRSHAVDGRHHVHPDAAVARKLGRGDCAGAQQFRHDLNFH